MGRPWLAFWMLPYPNTRGSLWVNFRTPLVWDFFAISTYFLISLTFWYVGLVPDLATARDRAKHPIRKRIFGLFFTCFLVFCRLLPMIAIGEIKGVLGDSHE